jgi:hypothetical protein
MAHVILEPYFLNGAIVYIDDTVIYGTDVENFLSVLNMVLTRMVQYNVRLKPSKCSFGMEENSLAMYSMPRGCDSATLGFKGFEISL